MGEGSLGECCGSTWGAAARRDFQLISYLHAAADTAMDLQCMAHVSPNAELNTRRERAPILMCQLVVRHTRRGQIHMTSEIH